MYNIDSKTALEAASFIGERVAANPNGSGLVAAPGDFIAGIYAAITGTAAQGTILMTKSIPTRLSSLITDSDFISGQQDMTARLFVGFTLRLLE